jgi:hypothetical protein
MNITIESLKSDLGSLMLRVAAFEAQQKKFTVSTVLGEIELQEGEVYVGLIVDADKGHHVILLPGDHDSINWKDAMARAESIGGDLPDRVEQALMFATMRNQFKPEWYWSNTQHASYSDFAWGQNFGNGLQDSSHKVVNYRARAVRRLPI